LNEKRAAAICCGSAKIEDDTQLKFLFQKYLMDGYSFTEIPYPFFNDAPDPNAGYADVVEYAKNLLKGSLNG